MEQFPPEKLFLTDEMLYPPQGAQLSDEDAGKTLDLSECHIQVAPIEHSPLAAPLMAAQLPSSSDSIECLQDIFKEQNSRLQGWALRNQTVLEDQLSAEMEDAGDLDATSGQ